MAENERYQTTLEGPQIDDALEQMNLRIPEGWAVGTRDGEDVPSTSQFYHNNAKYYAARAQAYSPIYMNVTSGTNARTLYDSAMMAYSNNGNMIIRVLVTDEGQSNYVWLRLLRRTNASDGNYRFDFAGVISPGVAPSPESGERKIVAFSVQRGGNDYIKYGPVIYTVPTKDYVDTVFQNMETAIDLKAPLASPHLTGTPTTPTATAGDNSTQIANTAFVQGELNEVATELSIAINGKANKSDLETVKAEALAAYVTETESGDIVTISDGADGIPVKSFVGSIIPQQDLNGYDNPWPAGGGANKWDEVAEAGGINDTTGQNATASGQFRSVNYIPVNPSNDYYVCYGGTASSHNIYVYFYASDQSFIGRASISGSYNVANKTITTPSNCTYIRFKTQITGESTYANNIAINYPSSVTTYSPYSNVCPISGWTGAEIYRTGINLCNPSTITDGYRVSNNGNIIVGANNAVTDYIPIKGNTSYYLRNSIGGSSFYSTAVYDENKTFIKNISINGSGAQSGAISTPENARYIRVNMLLANKADFAFNYPSTDHDYHAYNGSTILLDFGSTVYAGTLTALGGGLWKIQPTHAALTLNGSESWAAYASGNGYRMTVSGMSSGEAQTGWADWLATVPNLTSLGIEFGRNDTRIYAAQANTIPSVTDLASWQTYLATHPLTILYPLATLPDPITITGEDLQTLLGANTVWLDCGSVTGMTYRADPALYIDKRVTALFAALSQ